VEDLEVVEYNTSPAAVANVPVVEVIKGLVVENGNCRHASTDELVAVVEERVELLMEVENDDDCLGCSVPTSVSPESSEMFSACRLSTNGSVVERETVSVLCDDDDDDDDGNGVSLLLCDVVVVGEDSTTIRSMLRALTSS